MKPETIKSKNTKFHSEQSNICSNITIETLEQGGE